MKITSGLLADGREIIFYDELDAHDRIMHDPRPLLSIATSSTMRHDVVLDEWVAVARHRQDRTHLPPDDECPLCPSRNGRNTEIPAADYDVVVFENRFPSFADRHDVGEWTTTPMFTEGPAVGRCEVVCFTSEHDTSFSSLQPSRVRTVIEAWADRSSTLSALDGVEQIFCFENRGEEIGVTMSHPHGQIYAYPFVTPRTRRMLESARSYRQRTRHNLFTDVLAAERADGSRVVVSGDRWTAFVPFAARWPFEVHLYPHRQMAELAELTDAERDELARLHLDVLKRMAAALGDDVPYIAAWQQAPVHADRDLAYLHLQVFSIRRSRDKLKYLAGSESAMGAFVNDVVPEAAARLLREVEWQR